MKELMVTLGDDEKLIWYTRGGGVSPLQAIDNQYADFIFDASKAVVGDGVLQVNKPNDRTADFTVVRGSNATYIDRYGVMQDSYVVTDTELVTNGGFDTDSDWTLGTGWSILGGTANCDGSQSVESVLRQNNVITLSTVVKVKISISNYVSGNINIKFAPTQYSNYTSNGDYEFISDGLNTVNGDLQIKASTDFVGSIDNVSVKEISYDVPRIDWTNGVAELLCEPQSTNLITYSEDFSDASWFKKPGVTVTQNSIISPDGTLNADKIHFDNASLTLTQNVSININDTVSIYIKGTKNETIKFGVQGEENIYTLNGEWQRLTSTVSVTSTSLTINTYSGVTARDIYVWGAQLENLLYSTSYIKTEGSTVTRLIDSDYDAANVSTINSVEGTFAIKASALYDSLSDRIISLSDGTVNNQISISYSVTTQQIKADIIVGGVSQASMTKTVTDVTDITNIAVRWKVNDFSLWIDGIEEEATDVLGSSFVVSTLTKLNLGDGINANTFFSRTRLIKIYNVSLLDADMVLIQN